MTIRVASRARYYTGQSEKRQKDWDAFQFVRLVKYGTIKGYCSLTINGAERRLTSGDAAIARRLFAKWAAKKIRTVYSRPVTLIPIPSKSAVPGAPRNYVTLELAQLIQREMEPNAVARPALSWNMRLASTRDGGPRDPFTLYNALSLQETFESRPVVLIDDVWTLGGHIKACAAKLRDSGREVTLAVCCGRTTHDQEDSVFCVPDETLEDFDPDNWFSFA